MRLSQRRRPSGAPPIVSGRYAVRWGTPHPVAPGDQCRTVPCLLCGQAIGGGPAATVTITHYRPGRYAAGNMPAVAWLVHADHGRPTAESIQYASEWRLATGQAERRKDT